jgi:hypothetical protein
MPSYPAIAAEANQPVEPQSLCLTKPSAFDCRPRATIFLREFVVRPRAEMKPHHSNGRQQADAPLDQEGME